VDIYDTKNPLKPVIEAAPAAMLVQSRIPQKSFVFLLEENLSRAKSKSQTKLFFGVASVSERQRDGFLWSEIFDKMSSNLFV